MGGQAGQGGDRSDDSGGGQKRSGGTDSSSGGGGGSDGGGGSGGDEQSPSTAEKVVMVVSVTFTVALFAFAAWQAVSPPAGEAPTADVVGQRTTASGDVVFTVEVANPQDVGLRRATVEAACTSPPTEVGFEMVPAGGTRRGQMVCPPGTATPDVSVASWIEV